MHRISIQIRLDQYKRLKELCSPGLSIASLVRQAVDDFLKKMLQDKQSKVE